MLEINSVQNEKIKNLLVLKNSNQRKRAGKFVAEGLRELNLALLAGFEIDQLFICENFSKDKTLEIKTTERKIFKVDKKIFEKISYRENPDGFIGVLREKDFSLKNLKASPASLFLILEKVEKPGNFGAVLRTAEAAGLKAVILSDDSIDIYNHNAIRASQGALFSVNIIVDSNKNIIEWLQKNKIRILATTPHADTDYLDVNYQGASAIVIGSEDKGLSHEWLSAADEKIKIKMRGRADSLNVSVAAAVVVFEALRQRRL